MIFLKDYQIEVLEEIKNTFSTAYEKKFEIQRALQAIPENLRDSFPSVDWVELALNNLMKPYHDKCKNGLGEYYPRFVLKIPTGGGKTLLAVEAIRTYQNLFAKKRTGLVVWIVPTETIYTQTVQKIRDKSHHLRQLLDQCSGNRTIVLEKGQKLTTEDIEHNLVVLFVMIQSLSRANTKEALKVFQDSGGYESFFPADNRYDLHAELLKNYPNLDYISALGTSNPLIKTSLGNAIRVSRPFIIIDEIHKVFSETARNTIDSLNPEMVLGLSATPKKEMNILYSVSGLQLKNAEMVKLDMHILPPATKQKDDWRAMINEIKKHRENLEKKAKSYQNQTGIYIRPIALLKVEATGKDQRGKGRVHSLDVKDYLINQKISADEIAIKTSSQNDIEDVNLFSPDCPIRYIITKEALQEGWDCSFAYILGIIPNIQSDTSVTQLIGRILRQPNAKKTGVQDLDESYVYYSKGETREMIQRVSDGFKNEGLEDLFRNVKIQDNKQVHPSKVVRVKKDFAKKFSNAFYLPVWVMVDGKKGKRRFSYDIDIKSALPFEEFTLTKEHIKRIQDSLSEENQERKSIIVTLDEESKVKQEKEEISGVLENSFIDIEYLTRRYAEIIENPFLARKSAEKHIENLKQKINKKEIEKHFSFIVSMLCKFLTEDKQVQEENLFLSLLKNGKLLLAVSENTDIGFQIPESDVISVSDTPNTYKCYLFDDVEISTMNSLERRVGDILDNQEKILWWFRNKIGKNWYSIQGWQQYKIRPDFVAAKKNDNGKLELIYVLESKGEQLVGNSNSMYKEKVLKIMTEQTKDKKVEYAQSEMFRGMKIGEETEFYFIEQGQEEEKLKALLK